MTYFNQVSAELRETKDNVELPFLRLSIHGIGVDLKARTFDLALEAFIGGIYLQHLQYKGTVVNFRLVSVIVGLFASLLFFLFLSLSLSLLLCLFLSLSLSLNCLVQINKIDVKFT